MATGQQNLLGLATTKFLEHLPATTAGAQVVLAICPYRHCANRTLCGVACQNSSGHGMALCTHTQGIASILDIDSASDFAVGPQHRGTDTKGTIGSMGMSGGLFSGLLQCTPIRFQQLIHEEGMG